MAKDVNNQNEGQDLGLTETKKERKPRKKKETEESTKQNNKSVSYTTWKNEWRLKAKHFFIGIFATDFTEGERVKKTIHIPKELYEKMDTTFKTLNATFTKHYYRDNKKVTKGHFSENDFFNLLFMDSLNIIFQDGKYDTPRKDIDLLKYLDENKEEVMVDFNKLIEEKESINRERVRLLQQDKRRKEKEEKENLVKEVEELKKRLAEIEGKKAEKEEE